MKQVAARKQIHKWQIHVLILLLLGLCVTAVHGEETEGLHKLGTGNISIEIMVVTSVYDFPTIYEVHTNENNLLDALLSVDLIQGEEAPWGFNVTTVGGKEANYEDAGEYWEITHFVQGEGHLPLETGIGSAPVKSGDIFTFVFVDPAEEDW